MEMANGAALRVRCHDRGISVKMNCYTVNEPTGNESSAIKPRLLSLFRYIERPYSCLSLFLETKASTILEFLAGLRGSLFVTFEEGTWAAWLYDLLKPHVTEVLVCNPRKIPLLKQGNKSDKIDARKLAERLRLHDLKPVYHGETGVRTLRELARSYLTVVKDLSGG
jgi:hypothetical protein